jgi:signal transduction histidine kinase
MIRARLQPAETSAPKANKSFQAFRAFCGDIWIVPAVGVAVALLIFVIEHARLSEFGSKFLSAFIYALLIGFPTALSLNWIGFRYTERFPRFIFVINAAVLLAIATTGCLLGAFVLKLAGIIGPDWYWREVRASLPTCLVITVLVGLSIASYETLRHKLQDTTLELRTRQVEQERANKLLAEARLSSLESRIHPHFLFNTLNSIASLIPSDPKRAEDTVGKLASLLRFSISANQTSLVPLAQEMKVVRDYLEIEATRFGQRLHYEIALPDGLDTLKVPPLAVQTLVENSVKHVVSRRNAASSIRVDCTRHDRWCELSVTDDGPGFSLADISPDHGLGNLVGRLELLYSDAAQLDVTRAGEKTVVTIRIPFGESQ